MPAELENEPTETPEVPEVPATPPAKTFTQEELNRVVAKEKKSMQKQLDEMKATFQQELSNFKDKLPKEPEPSTEAGVLQVKLMRADASIASLQKELDQTREEVSKERQLRRESERDRVLNDALNASNVSPKLMKTARKLFISDLVYDDDTGKWLFQKEDGSAVDVTSGIALAVEQAKFLRPSDIEGGGTGAPAKQNGTQNKPASVNARLTEAKKRLAVAAEDAKKSGGRGDAFARYNLVRREVLDLEDELAGKPPRSKAIIEGATVVGSRR